MFATTLFTIPWNAVPLTLAYVLYIILLPIVPKWVDTLLILFPKDGDGTGPQNSVLVCCPCPCTDDTILHSNPTNALTPFCLHWNSPACSWRMAHWWPQYVGVFQCQQNGSNACKFSTDFYVTSVLLCNVSAFIIIFFYVRVAVQRDIFLY